jgi:outer membrane receptor protein involved in Fe transport
VPPFFRVPIAAFAALAVPAALADGVHRIETIEVTSHYENGIGTTDAASAGAITPELLEDRPLLRPGEVLELVPGLVVTQHSGAGKANQFYLRGFNLDHGTDFLTTVAGMPVNMRTHAHGQGYTDLNFLIPELVERIDYYKGPYYASKGDFASAGAADIHYANALAAGRLEATAGSFDDWRALAAGSSRVAGGDLLYGLELFGDDGPWDHPDGFRKANGVLRYSSRTGEARWDVTAMAYGGHWNATDQIPRRAVEQGLIDRFGSLDPTDGGRSHRYSVSGDLAAPLAGGEAQLSAYAIKYDLDLFSNFTYFLDDPVHGDQFEQKDDRRVLGASGGWSRGGNRIGFELRQDRIAPVGLYATQARERLSTTREDRVHESSASLYAENETSWSGWLRTVAGVRGDAYSFKVDSSLAANSGDAYDHLVSPKLSIILGPWSRTELFLNYGAGFHSNDARGVTSTVDPRTGEALQPVTPLVRTRGAEVGARTEWIENVQSSIAFWRLDLDSELVFAGDAATTEPSRASKRTGVEWSTRWKPKRWLLVDADLAWSRARFTDPDPAGDYVPGAIERAASAGVTLHDFGPWSASLFMRYFGPRPLVEDNSVRSSSSTIFNAQASYRLNPKAQVALEVFNLFDRQVDDVAYYYASRLRGEPASGVDDIHFHPAEPRGFRVTLRWMF